MTDDGDNSFITQLDDQHVSENKFFISIFRTLSACRKFNLNLNIIKKTDLFLAMNTKQFITAFMMVATVVSVQGLGDLAAVTLNGALTLPLLAATSGTFGTALAVLGALKLGAAALFLASQLKAPEEASSYESASSYHGYRQKRAAHQSATATNPDALFDLISAMDHYGCGKQLVCELEAKPQSELATDEYLLLSLFG